MSDESNEMESGGVTLEDAELLRDLQDSIEESIDTLESMDDSDLNAAPQIASNLRALRLALIRCQVWEADGGGDELTSWCWRPWC